MLKSLLEKLKSRITSYNVCYTKLLRLEGMKQAMRVGLEPVKINVVLIGGFNDNEIADFAELTKEGFEVRFIELMPVGEATQWSLNQFIPNTTVITSYSIHYTKLYDLSY